MKNLPNRWLVNLKKEKDSLLIEKFLTWFNKINKDTPSRGFDFHGYWDNIIGFWSGDGNHKYFITLRQWNEMIFGLTPNEQLEKGEEVLVKDKHHDSWVEKTFICEYKGKFIGENKGFLTSWDECKKKPSELDIKIEELKKLAEEKGVKITVICE